MKANLYFIAVSHIRRNDKWHFSNELSDCLCILIVWNATLHLFFIVLSYLLYCPVLYQEFKVNFYCRRIILVVYCLFVKSITNGILVLSKWNDISSRTFPRMCLKRRVLYLSKKGGTNKKMLEKCYNKFKYFQKYILLRSWAWIYLPKGRQTAIQLEYL